MIDTRLDLNTPLYLIENLDMDLFRAIDAAVTNHTGQGLEDMISEANWVNVSRCGGLDIRHLGGDAQQFLADFIRTARNEWDAIEAEAEERAEMEEAESGESLSDLISEYGSLALTHSARVLRSTRNWNEE